MSCALNIVLYIVSSLEIFFSCLNTLYLVPYFSLKYIFICSYIDVLLSLFSCFS